MNSIKFSLEGTPDHSKLFSIKNFTQKKLEKIENKSLLDIRELYFDDDLDLRIMVRNKSMEKYPFRKLRFINLETTLKRKFIFVLKLKV